MTGQLQEAAGRVYADWPTEPMDDGNGYAVEVEGADGTWTALVLTDDENHVFCFYSLSPVDVPADDEAAMQRMSEFVDRANLGMVAAAFELDRDTGEVRLRSGMELGTLPVGLRSDDTFLEAVVLDLSSANIGIMNTYLSGLVAVVLGEVPVADIVAQIES